MEAWRVDSFFKSSEPRFAIARVVSVKSWLVEPKHSEKNGMSGF